MRSLIVKGDRFMKKMSCRDLGGPCNAEIQGNSADEIAKAGYEHIKEVAGSGDDAHKSLLENIDSSSKEDKDKWMVEHEKKFTSAQDV